MAISAPKDGIYEFRSRPGFTAWPLSRQVYIQNGYVRLVPHRCTPKVSVARVIVFMFQNFFNVNTLGPRVSDLPANFNIRK